MTKTVTQWKNGSLITFKMFPRYCPRSPHTGKKIKLHLEAHISFTSFIYIEPSELHSIAKPQALPEFKILVLEASLSRNKFLATPETWSMIRNFANFTRKHLCWSLFLIKLQTWKYVKNRLQHWCFPMISYYLINFWEYLFWRTSATECF